MHRKLEPEIVNTFREGYTKKLFQGDLLGGLTVGVALHSRLCQKNIPKIMKRVFQP
ncbi:MAG: hypothetical protein KF685_13160 [Acidobacteria bacterium]|nr:hypothetical protein [Acidobacteriota bacterium]